MTIPFLDLAAERADVQADLVEAARRVIARGSFILGEEVETFEREFASAVGADFCVGVASGLDALTLTLRAWDLGPGDEVIVPTCTYIATWLAVSAVGATPVPVDPDPQTLTIGPAQVVPSITARTAAILPVHLYGLACDVDAIRAALGGKAIRILEDAAQAHGARSRGVRAGALGDAAAFSFYPSKVLGALGDAGAVTTSDRGLAGTLKVLRNYGASSKYHHEVQGVNSRLDELQAGFLRVKLPQLEGSIRRRAALADRYLDRLADLPGVVLPATAPEDGRHAWYVFVIHLDGRDGVRDALAARGIGTQLYYPEPPHLSGAYGSLGYAVGDFPVAERAAATNLALPLSPHLSDRQQESVIDAVTDIVTGGAHH